MSDLRVKTILFVDDERQILRALNRLFLRSEYMIVLAESADEALSILSTQHVDMMITDMRMAEMNGHQLLIEVKKKYNHIIRIALSGYADKEMVLSVLDKNLAKIYLFKPWGDDELEQTIERLFEFERLLKSKNLLEVIVYLENLPTMPHLYQRITQMVEEQKSVDDISKCLEEDQAITSRILRIANSAYYGSKTGSIKEAIMFIGLDNVKNIILTNAVFDTSVKDRSSIERIWKHAGETNKLVNLIYRKLLKEKLRNVEMSAGLLHNIGETIILTNINVNSKEDLMNQLYDKGISHEQIGGYLLDWWELPMPIVECAMFHHQPDDHLVVNKKLVCAVHVAEYFAWKIIGEAPQSALSLNALEQLGISTKNVEQLMDDYY